MNDQPELSPEQRAKLKAELLAELKAELKQDAEQSEPVKPEPEPEKPNNPNVFPYKNYSASTDPEPPTKPVEGNYDKYIMSVTSTPTTRDTPSNPTKDTPELSKYDKYIMEKRAENKRAEKTSKPVTKWNDEDSAWDTVLGVLGVIWIGGGLIGFGMIHPGFGLMWAMGWLTVYKNSIQPPMD